MNVVVLPVASHFSFDFLIFDISILRSGALYFCWDLIFGPISPNSWSFFCLDLAKVCEMCSWFPSRPWEICFLPIACHFCFYLEICSTSSFLFLSYQSKSCVSSWSIFLRTCNFLPLEFWVSSSSFSLWPCNFFTNSSFLLHRVFESCVWSLSLMLRHFKFCVSRLLFSLRSCDICACY